MTSLNQSNIYCWKRHVLEPDNNNFNNTIDMVKIYGKNFIEIGKSKLPFIICSDKITDNSINKFIISINSDNIVKVETQKIDKKLKMFIISLPLINTSTALLEKKTVVAIEDIAKYMPLDSGMILRIGNMAKGPEIRIQLEKSGEISIIDVITNQIIITSINKRPIEVGRGIKKQLTEFSDMFDRCNINVPEDIFKCISRKHCIIEWHNGIWWLTSHPNNDSFTDINRERSTWLILEPGKYYEVRGIRDGKTAVFHSSTIPLLIEGNFSPLHETIELKQDSMVSKEINNKYIDSQKIIELKKQMDTKNLSENLQTYILQEFTTNPHNVIIEDIWFCRGFLHILSKNYQKTNVIDLIKICSKSSSKSLFWDLCKKIQTNPLAEARESGCITPGFWELRLEYLINKFSTQLQLYIRSLINNYEENIGPEFSTQKLFFMIRFIWRCINSDNTTNFYSNMLERLMKNLFTIEKVQKIFLLESNFCSFNIEEDDWILMIEEWNDPTMNSLKSLFIELSQRVFTSNDRKFAWGNHIIFSKLIRVIYILFLQSHDKNIIQELYLNLKSNVEKNISLIEIFNSIVPPELNIFDIIIYEINGDVVCNLSIDLKTKISDIKENITSVLNILSIEQQLLFDNIIVYDDYLLFDIFMNYFVPCRTHSYNSLDKNEYMGQPLYIDQPLLFTLFRQQRPDHKEWLKVIQENLRNFHMVPKELTKDRIFMGLAVEEDGHALAYADIELLQDCKLILTAIRKTPSAITYAKYNALMNKELWIEAIRLDNSVKYYIPYQLEKELSAYLV